MLVQHRPDAGPALINPPGKHDTLSQCWLNVVFK